MTLKTLLRKGVLLLLALLMAAAAYGCRGGGESTQSSGDGGQSETAGEDGAPIRWDSESAAQYVIVVASNASDAEREAAGRLQAAFLQA